MKKLLLLIGLICCFGSASAQTKTAYCDVYMRGGYDCMTVTIMYDSNSHRLNRSYSMGEILNIMAEDDWVLDNDIVIPRHPWFSFFTRHKLHLIMKKEYNKGEDPFAFVKLFCQKKAYIDEVKEDTDPVVEVPKENEIQVTEQVVKEPNVKESTAKEEESTTEESKKKTVKEVEAKPALAAIKAKYEDYDVFVIHEYKNHAIIVLNIELYGTWNEATDYCNKMGKKWSLPNTNNAKYINTDDDFWTTQQLDSSKAYYYDTYMQYFVCTGKNREKRIYPVARVSKSEIIYVE